MAISLLISGISGKLGKVIAEELENTENIDNTQYEFNRAYQLARKYPTLIAVSDNGDIELVEGNFKIDELKSNIERILNS